MRKKIGTITVVIASLILLYAQPVAAAYRPVPGVTIDAWTDKPQYAPAEKGILKISILNLLDRPVSIKKIYIEYPWYAYDAKEDEWMGNQTFEGTPLATMDPNGGANDHYYKEVEFTVPEDGRTMGNDIEIDVVEIDVDMGVEGIAEDFPVPLYVASISVPMEIVDLDVWMTSLIVAVVICTIILAIAVFLSTRRAPTPRFTVPPPPPKPKAKAE